MMQSTRLQYFQYKLLTKKLKINIDRSKYDPKFMDRCTFCNHSPKSVLHLMLECTKVAKLWKLLARWLTYMLKIDVKLEDPGTIICNNYNGPGKEIVNMILLVTKQYIYATRSL